MTRGKGGSKRSLSRNELQDQYRAQSRLLRKSCKAYDSGDSDEARRIASSLRLLLHDGPSSRSLLGQLGLKDFLFFDTAQAVDPRNLLPTFALIVIGSRGGSPPRYQAPLGLPLGRPVWMIPFRYWWSKPVIVVPNDISLVRSDVVMTMANQDGGAHVDPALEESYYRITREHVGGWTANYPEGERPIEDVEGASVRQIAQELMTTLITGSATIPSDLPGELSDRDWVAQFGRARDSRDTPLRNMCPCDSGLEYRQCHMAGGINVGKVVAPRWASQEGSPDGTDGGGAVL